MPDRNRVSRLCRAGSGGSIPGMRNIRLTIEYDGEGFHGWQVQPAARTVQGEIERILHMITGQKIRLVSSSRTDAGVHALGQVANFHLDDQRPLPSFQRSMNSLLQGEVIIREIEEMPACFHARFNAVARKYRYLIAKTPYPPLFENKYSWHNPAAMDVDAMNRCARMILGELDFSAFRSSSCGSRTPFRLVREAAWFDKSRFRVFRIEANAFLKQMVRILVGTMVQVGRGVLSLEDFHHILTGRDRTAAGATAPARGLTLMEVRYDNSEPQLHQTC